MIVLDKADDKNAQSNRIVGNSFGQDLRLQGILSNNIQNSKHDKIWKDRQDRITALSPPPDILSRHPTYMKGLKLLDLTQAENMSGLTMTNTINNFDKSKSNYI